MEESPADPLGTKILELYERAVDIALAADEDDHAALENGIRAGWYLFDKRASSLELAERDRARNLAASDAEIPNALLSTDPLVLHVAIDDAAMPMLLDLLREMRREIVAAYGVIPPGTVVRLDEALGEDGYRIELHGDTMETGTFAVDEVARRVHSVVEANLAELLTREEVAELLNRARRTQPMVVQELVPNMLALGQLRQVLQHLVRERVPIRNHAAILNALADHAAYTKEPAALVEHVRRALGRTICARVADERRLIRAIRLSPSVEGELQASVQLNEMGQVLMLDGTTAASIRAQAIERCVPSGSSS